MNNSINKGAAAFDKRTNTGLRHLVNAARFSLQGLRQCFRREAAFRQEVALLAVALAVGAWCAGTLLDFVLLACACLLVLAVELVNSGIEAAIDRLGEEQHELSGLAKDYGSAAVMMALLIVAVVFGYILLDFFSRSP
ncbi:MAG: diacylglycerol kinase [Pseudomonadales bacterium]